MPLPTMKPILSEAWRSTLLPAPVRHETYLLPPTPMLSTLSCVIPDVNPIAVLDPIPASAWDEAITTAERQYSVRLAITRHAQPGEEPHYHIDMTGEEDDLPMLVPPIARLVARVLRAHTKRVTLPEGR